MEISILKVENLFKQFINRSWFGKKSVFTAVDNISFSLKEGEILGILGPNGAGKTTTIQMLLGLLSPTSGSINYFGKNFFKNRSEIMEHVTFASSYLKMPSSLTVLENLNLYGNIYSLDSKTKSKNIENILSHFKLYDLKDNLTRTLSAGQLTRLMLAKAFLPNPKIILLDEPTAALDPDIASQIRKFILERRREANTSILFTSHNMAEVEELCDRVLILKQGKIIASENPYKLASKIQNTRINLFITQNIEVFIKYLQENNYKYKNNNLNFEIEIDEYQICNLLNDIALLKIRYNQISIDRPSLEDYFLEISK